MQNPSYNDRRRPYIPEVSTTYVNVLVNVRILKCGFCPTPSTISCRSEAVLIFKYNCATSDAALSSPTHKCPIYCLIMRSKSAIDSSGDPTYNSVNCLRNAGGRSLFPTSVAGFIHANIRKSECGFTASRSPFSGSVIEPPPLIRPAIVSKVSDAARLISSSSNQSPRFNVLMILPSTNEKA